MQCTLRIVPWHSVIALSWHNVTTLCYGTGLRHCAMAQGCDIVSWHSVTLCHGTVTTLSWHRFTTLCQGAALRHCATAQSYYIVSWHRVATLCKAQRYIVMAQSYDILSKRSVTTMCHGTELRHCARHSVTMSLHRVTTLCQGAALWHCHVTELHCFQRLTITTTHKGRHVVGQNSNMINDCDTHIIPYSLAEHRLSILLRSR